MNSLVLAVKISLKTIPYYQAPIIEFSYAH